MKDTEAAIRKRINKERDKLDRIEQAKFEKAHRPSVGKWFKYRNNYSCPEGPADYWLVYRKVLRIEGQSVMCFDFQTDKYGNIRIDPENRGRITEGWYPCSQAEAIEAWQAVMNKLKRFIS